MALGGSTAYQLIDLDSLTQLHLGNNQLGDSIPWTLGDLDLL